MKPHPRIRKTIKWGGAVVTVLLVVVWVGSGWCIALGYPRLSVWGFDLTAWYGCLGLAWKSSPSDFVLMAHYKPFQWGSFTFALLPTWLSHAGGFSISVPLWPVVLLSLVVTGKAWRLDTLAHRRARLNLCPKCNYDRTGLAVGAKCPECGSGGVSA